MLLGGLGRRDLAVGVEHALACVMIDRSRVDAIAVIKVRKGRRIETGA